MARQRALAPFLLKHSAGHVRQLRLDLGYCDTEQSAAECVLLTGLAATACSGLQKLDLACLLTVAGRQPAWAAACVACALERTHPLRWRDAWSS